MSGIAQERSRHTGSQAVDNIRSEIEYPHSSAGHHNETVEAQVGHGYRCFIDGAHSRTAF
jgi:hypothetical protein